MAGGSTRTASVLEIVRASLGAMADFGAEVAVLAARARAPREREAALARLAAAQESFEHHSAFLKKVVALMLQKGRARQAHLVELLVSL